LTDPRSILYVALGDGMSASGGLRLPKAWPEIVADVLSPSVGCTNLAAVGATTEDVLRAQLPLAIALRAEVVSVICGANDVIRSARPDLDALANRLDRIFWRLREGLADPLVITATYPDLAGIRGLGPRARRRVTRHGLALNAHIRELADKYGVLLFDQAARCETWDPVRRGTDGPYPAPHTHIALAAQVVAALERSGISDFD
jgi:lysophospholipase L1-like esterase